MVQQEEAICIWFCGRKICCKIRVQALLSEELYDHCYELYDGRPPSVLGSVGLNFGTGMTGGFAYVLDEWVFLIV